MSKTFQYEYDVNRFFCIECQRYLEEKDIIHERFRDLWECKNCANTEIIFDVQTSHGKKRLVRKYPEDLIENCDILYDGATGKEHLVYAVKKSEKKGETVYKINLKEFGHITVEEGEWVNCLC